MKQKYTQLDLNFEGMPVRPHRNEEPPSAREATPVVCTDHVSVAPARIVHLKSVREQRERNKRVEEERRLMERIRARVAHLQA